MNRGSDGPHRLIAFVFVLTRTTCDFEIFLAQRSHNYAMSSLQYKKVLVLGATSGIGWALAAKVYGHSTYESY